MPFGTRRWSSNVKNKPPIKETTNNPKEFIIVGAGMAGLYTSYRLHQLYDRPRIRFIEASNYVGGRLISVDIGQGSQMEPTQDVFIEKGGMRILTGQQPLIEKLVKTLDINLYNPPPATAANFDFYRGRRVYPAQVKNGNIPFNLTQCEKGKTGEELIDMGINIIMQQNNITPQELDQRGAQLSFWESLSYNGTKLTDWNSTMWLHSYLSTDGVEYVFESQGYDSFPKLINLAMFLYYNNSDKVIFKGNTDAFKFIEGGYSRIPKKLYQIAVENGDTFHFNCQLSSIYQRGSVTNITVQDKTEGRVTTKHYQTSNLILAVPVPVLKDLSIVRGKIQGIDDDTLAVFHRCLESVKGFDAFRIFPVFKEAWWREKFGIIGGRCNTNTPFKQVYYWNSPPKGEGPGVLLLYSDFYDAETLESYIPQQPTPCAEDEKNIPSLLNSTQTESLRKLLSQIHHTEAPPITKAYIKWWPVAWDLYLPHNTPSQTFHQAPTILDPISVVGVGMSLDQGWVEGALQTVEELLTTAQFR